MRLDVALASVDILTRPVHRCRGGGPRAFQIAHLNADDRQCVPASADLRGGAKRLRSRRRHDAARCGADVQGQPPWFVQALPASRAIRDERRA